MVLNEQQRKVVEATEDFIVVSSAAGSGKTSTLTARLQNLIENFPNDNIVAITFTKAAATELIDRMGNIPSNCFIGTIHSYCNTLLKQGGVSTTKIIAEENFDELFSLFQQHPECRANIDYLLIDEAQDTTLQQFSFLLESNNVKHWMMFGDLRQSIFGFADADPTYLSNLMMREDVKTYELSRNYRCGRNILNFAKGLINYLGFKFEDNSIAVNDGGRVMYVDYTMDNIYKAIITDNESNYGDWFILTRTNQQLEQAQNFLKEKDIPCESFKRQGLNNAQILKKMEANTVKILTIHTAKGLEAKNVIVAPFAFSRSAEERRLAYVAATRAIDNLYWGRSAKKTRAKKKTQDNTVSWE